MEKFLTPSAESDPESMPFRHKNLDARLQDAMQESEIEGGVNLDNVPMGKNLIIETKHTTYKLEKREDGLYLSGNPKLCPEPRKVYINGSTYGGTSLKLNYVGRGMLMEFRFADEETLNPTWTSKIKEITEQ